MNDGLTPWERRAVRRLIAHSVEDCRVFAVPLKGGLVRLFKQLVTPCDIATLVHVT
jgi:hypothetical protein